MHAYSKCVFHICLCLSCPLTILFCTLQNDQNQAISMVSYYASSSEPAQVRGKTVYIQYSNRQEIVNNKSTGDVASNVLLVTIEGVEAGDVSIDVLHLVSLIFCLSFGLVKEQFELEGSTSEICLLYCLLERSGKPAHPNPSCLQL